MFRTFAPLAVATLIGVGTPAAALTPSEAEALTQRIVTQVESQMAGAANRTGAFERLMQQYADVDAIARYALGTPWRGASAAQQAGFTRAFTEYVARKYGGQFDDYRGSSIEVLGARDLGNRGVVVETRVLVPGSQPVLVEWQFDDRAGEAQLVDIVAEGVSLLASERATIGRMLDRRGGDLDRLIADLPAQG